MIHPYRTVSYPVATKLPWWVKFFRGDPSKLSDLCSFTEILEHPKAPIGVTRNHPWNRRILGGHWEQVKSFGPVGEVSSGEPWIMVEKCTQLDWSHTTCNCEEYP